MDNPKRWRGVANPGNQFGLLLSVLLFLGGWGVYQRMANIDVYQLWIWGAYCGAGVTLIHGSWRVVPRLLLGFGLAQTIGWTLFYAGDWYYPDAEDVSFIVGFGCCVATLFGSRFLIVHGAPHLVRGEVSRRLSTSVPVVCHYGSLMLFGGFAYVWSEHAIHRFPAVPEFAAILAALSCCLGLFVARANQNLGRDLKKSVKPVNGNGSP